jgi:hypothetical protein
LVVIGVLLAISSATLAADKAPDLLNCNCQSWNTYEEDFASWLDRRMRLQGVNPSQIVYENNKRDASFQKLSYIAGLIEAYNEVYIKTHKEYYNLPYRIGQYLLELDAFAEDPKHTDIPISRAILIVNKQMRHK